MHHMGTLLPFQPRPAAGPRHDALATGGAQIIIFTGVRYERTGQAEPSRQTPAKMPKRPRKTGRS